MRAVATARIRIQSTRHGLPTARSVASLEAPEDRVKQMLSAEADGIVGRQTRLLRRLGDRRAGRRRLDPRGVEGDACHLRLACRKGYRLVQSHELREAAGSGGRGCPISVAPAE